jgi:Mg/Co/Ni transporter MgtE
VLDYVPGKVDWLARSLPTEGEKANERRVGAFARDDAVTCRMDERVADVVDRVEASRYKFALVVARDGRTLLGRLPRSACQEHPDGTVEEAMKPGPSTVRPDMDPAKLRERLEERDLKTAIVSTPEGELIGVVTRASLG